MAAAKSLRTVVIGIGIDAGSVVEEVVVLEVDGEDDACVVIEVRVVDAEVLVNQRSHRIAIDAEAVATSITIRTKTMSELSIVGAPRGCAVLGVAQRKRPARPSHPFEAMNIAGMGSHVRPFRKEVSPAMRSSSSKVVEGGGSRFISNGCPQFQKRIVPVDSQCIMHGLTIVFVRASAVMHSVGVSMTQRSRPLALASL